MFVTSDVIGRESPPEIILLKRITRGSAVATPVQIQEMHLRIWVILATALDRICAILAGAKSQLVVMPERLDETKELYRRMVSAELLPQMLAYVLHRSLDGRRVIDDRQPKVLLCYALAQ